MTVTAGTEHLLVVCRGVETLGQARLAQSVERQALNLVVGGSSPPVGDLLLFLRRFVTLLFSFDIALTPLIQQRVHLPAKSNDPFSSPIIHKPFAAMR